MAQMSQRPGIRNRTPPARAEGPDPDAAAFRHGQVPNGWPVTWTGRIVSLANRHARTGSERHRAGSAASERHHARLATAGRGAQNEATERDRTQGRAPAPGARGGGRKVATEIAFGTKVATERTALSRKGTARQDRKTIICRNQTRKFAEMAGGKPGTPQTAGRQKSTQNQAPALLEHAIVQAAIAAGDGAGLEGYLTMQATANSGPFMALPGQVLPKRVEGNRGLTIVIAKNDVGLQP